MTEIEQQILSLFRVKPWITIDDFPPNHFPQETEQEAFIRKMEMLGIL